MQPDWARSARRAPGLWVIMLVMFTHVLGPLPAEAQQYICSVVETVDDCIARTSRDEALQEARRAALDVAQENRNWFRGY